MLKLLLSLFTVCNFVRTNCALFKLVQEDLDFFKKDCFPSNAMFDEEKCFETIDASLLTNKSLLKGMVLAVNYRALPLSKAVARAQSLNKAGQSAFLMYYLKQKRELKAYLNGKVRLDRKVLEKLDVYDYFNHWKTASEERKNEARFHKLASALFYDPHSSLDLLRSPPKPVTKHKLSKMTVSSICNYLKASGLTKKCFEPELVPRNLNSFEMVLGELQRICSDEHVSSKNEGFLETLLQREFDGLRELKEFIMSESKSPVYTFPLLHEIDQRHHFSTFGSMGCWNESMAAIVQIKGKYGPHSSNLDTMKAPGQAETSTDVALSISLE